MAESFRNFLEILFSYPYVYILIFSIVIILITIILLLVFHKQIFHCIREFCKRRGRGLTLTVKKESTTVFGMDSKSKSQVVFRKMDLENSEIQSVTGSVTMEDVKMKNSSVGDIRSE